MGDLLDPSPLLAAAGYRPTDHGLRRTAERLGTSMRQVHRWAHEGQAIRLHVADRCAIRLDRHPAELWPEWSTMSALGDDAEVVDKAGFSGNCRRGDHRLCQTSGFRCSCTCHGPKGQTPRETPMTEASVTPLPSKPRAVHDPEPFECDDCGRTFGRSQALGRHRTAVHGAASKAKPAKERAKKPSERKAEGVGERQALAVIAAAYVELCSADVAVAIESAGFLLDAIEAQGWRLVES